MTDAQYYALCIAAHRRQWTRRIGGTRLTRKNKWFTLYRVYEMSTLDRAWVGAYVRASR